MTSIIVITTTSDDRDQLQRIAERLVQDRLAACCQIIGPHTSIYRWQGNIETATEWMCLIKTVRERFEQVADMIRQLHPYEVPEIIATEIVDGGASYLKWIQDQVNGENLDPQ